MEKRELLYEGKAKRVFATENAEIVIQEFKDDATAFNGEKKGTIVGKGVINNKISCKLFKMLEKEGVPTHLISEIDGRNMLIKKVDIVKLEVIVRNIAAGSFSKRFGVEEGRLFTAPTLEFSYKDDSLGDPLMNDYHAIAIGVATRAEIDTISKYALKINEVLKAYFDARNIILVDFKLEFGRLADGTIVLADEISPDTCRFWDKDTKEKLDKDRFRRNLGNVEEAYQEMLKRLS